MRLSSHGDLRIRKGGPERRGEGGDLEAVCKAMQTPSCLLLARQTGRPRTQNRAEGAEAVAAAAQRRTSGGDGGAGAWPSLPWTRRMQSGFHHNDRRYGGGAGLLHCPPCPDLLSLSLTSPAPHV